MWRFLRFFGGTPEKRGHRCSLFWRVNHGSELGSAPFCFFAPIDCIYHLNHIYTTIFPEKHFTLIHAEMRYSGQGRCFVFVPKPVYVTIYVTTLCLQGLSFASAPWAEIASLDRRFFLRPSRIPFLCDRITQIEIGVHIWNLRALYIPKHPEFFFWGFCAAFFSEILWRPHDFWKIEIYYGNSGLASF